MGITTFNLIVFVIPSPPQPQTSSIHNYLLVFLSPFCLLQILFFTKTSQNPYSTSTKPSLPSQTPRTPRKSSPTLNHPPPNNYQAFTKPPSSPTNHNSFTHLIRKHKSSIVIIFIRVNVERPTEIHPAKPGFSWVG